MKSSLRSELLRIFSQLYPNPESELNFKDDYQLLIAVMLSAQCTDKKVNQITPILFEMFSDFKSLSLAKLSAIEQIIRPINYYRTKSKHLISTAKLITQKHHGKVPLNYIELTELPGVGRKTANVVLGELGIEATLPVDTHVYRVSKRLGLSSKSKRDDVEWDIRDKFAPKWWRMLHHSLILHGRKICKAQNPLCNICELSTICPSRKLYLKVNDLKKHSK